MENFDERVTNLIKSERIGADIRMPMDVRARLEKSAKKESKDSVDGIDQDKIRKVDEEDKKKDGDEDEQKEKPEEKEEQYEKSFYASETQTLAKSLLVRASLRVGLVSRIGAWMGEKLQKSQSIDLLARSGRSFLEKAAGQSIVMGMPVKNTKASGAAYARIVALNAEAQQLQKKISECAEPDEQVKYNKSLRAVWEKLALAVMASEGLGLQTEDLIKVKAEKVDAQPGVAKSQAEPNVIIETESDVKLVVTETEKE